MFAVVNAASTDGAEGGEAKPEAALASHAGGKAAAAAQALTTYAFRVKSADVVEQFLETARAYKDGAGGGGAGAVAAAAEQEQAAGGGDGQAQGGAEEEV